MANSTIPRSTSGLFFKRSNSTTSTNTITPASANAVQWFLMITSNQRAAGHVGVAVMNYYNGACVLDSVFGATSWSATISDGVITVTKGNSYLPMSVFSDLHFTLS